MTQPYERLKSESDRAWKAFCDYMAMPPPRTVKALHEHYTRVTPTEDPPSLSYSTLRDWHYHHRWDERCEAFDAEQDQLRLQRLREVKARNYEQEILAFRNAIHKSGREQVRLSFEASKILDSLIRSFYEEESLENKLKVVAGICNLMRSVPTLTASGFEAWGRSIGIDRLLSESQ